MALALKTQRTLVDALSNKTAAAELQAIVAARAGTPSRTLVQCLCDAMASGQTVGANGKIPNGLEVLNALVSGANLSLKARQKILTMMAGDGTPTGYVHAAGNELINFIQTVPQTSNTTL